MERNVVQESEWLNSCRTVRCSGTAGWCHHALSSTTWCSALTAGRSSSEVKQGEVRDGAGTHVHYSSAGRSAPGGHVGEESRGVWSCGACLLGRCCIRGGARTQRSRFMRRRGSSVSCSLCRSSSSCRFFVSSVLGSRIPLIIGYYNSTFFSEQCFYGGVVPAENTRVITKSQN